MSRSAVLLIALGLIACGGEDSSDLDIPVDPVTGLRIAALPPVPPLPEWPDNPPSEAKKELGRILFNDGRLSGSGTAVCGVCHLAITKFQSAAPRDTPDRSYPNLTPVLHRNAPSLLNVVYAPMMRWDGSHFTDVYDMMSLPFAEANMNLSGLGPEHGEEVDVEGAQAVMFDKLTVEIPGYVDLFQEAFAVDIRSLSEEEVFRLVGKAIAVYLRVAVARDAEFDAWNAGDDDAIDDAAKRGAMLFMGKANCIACHSGPFMSDFKFHNISTSPPNEDGNRDDEGRFLATGEEADRGAFLTPMLRGAAGTSPYFHDGRYAGFRAAIEFKMSAQARVDPLHDPIIATVPPLSDDEINDLVRFIVSMDGADIPFDDLRGPESFPQ